MDEMTRAFLRVVAQSRCTAAQWMAWHTQRLGELAADPVARLELEHALRDSPELLEAAQIALDSVGAVVADAAMARMAPSAQCPVPGGTEPAFVEMGTEGRAPGTGA